MKLLTFVVVALKGQLNCRIYSQQPRHHYLYVNENCRVSLEECLIINPIIKLSFSQSFYSTPKSIPRQLVGNSRVKNPCWIGVYLCITS
jgi:hypothetical protein